MYIVKQMASSCEVSTRCSVVPLSDGPAKASCIPRVCCRAWRARPKTNGAGIIVYLGVKMDAEVLLEVLFVPFLIIIIDLNRTAAGDRVAVGTKKHYIGMCPLKWCSPGYKRWALSQEARRLSCAPCWIWREPACYPGRRGTGQGEAAHCCQPQIPPDNTNHLYLVTTWMIAHFFVMLKAG